MSFENLAKVTGVDEENHSWDDAAVRLEGLADKYQRQSQGAIIHSKKVRHLNEVRALLKIGKGKPLIAEGADESADEAFLDALEKIEAQIRRRKGKRIKRLKRRGKTIRLLEGATSFNESTNGGLHAGSP